MEDLGKVNSMQLYDLWKNLTVGLVSLIAMIAFSKLLPYYLSPVISLVFAAALYVYVYNSRSSRSLSCMIVPYGILCTLMAYSFILISLNIAYAWGMELIPLEIVFFNEPFIPTLISSPVGFIVFGYFTMRRRSVHVCHVCAECKIQTGGLSTSRSLGSMLSREAHYQVKNLFVMFGLLSAVIWSYYLVFYVNININARDWYIFVWLTVICFMLDELYFAARYYNLYLDLRENNEIITQEELNDMTAKTYLRYYVICGNHIFVDAHALDPKSPYKEIIDTPFFTKRTVNGIPVSEVKDIISRMTGYPNGELRFFYGRKTSEFSKNSVLRYFYFLDGDVKDYSNMNVDGEWMDYEKIKYLYSNNPAKLADLSVTDTTRLATIILTEKTFDEEGFRKSKIKLYNPSFNLIDVRNSTLDFQDDKWIRISMFNSDTPLFRLKRWWKKIMNSSSSNRTIS